MAEPAEGGEEAIKEAEAAEPTEPAATTDSSEPKKDSLEDETALLAEFYPVPYLFLLKDASGNDVFLPPTRLVNARIDCPRFHVLVDHLMAVLWCYYSKKGLDLLESNQIHWALKILEGQRNSLGQYTADVQMAINHLTDAYVEVCSKADMDKLQNRSYVSNINMSYRNFRKRKNLQSTTIGIENFEEDFAKQAELQNTSIHLADMISDADASEINELVTSKGDPESVIPEGMLCINQKVLLPKGQGEENMQGEQKTLLEVRNQKFQSVVDMLEEIRKLDETIQNMPSTRGEALQSMLDPILKKPEEGGAEEGEKPEEEAPKPDE